MSLLNFQSTEKGMSKYKILWIDDKWEEMDSFKEVCELPKHGMEIVPCKYSVDGMQLFEQRLEEWSGVILDAKVLMDKDAKLDQLKGLTYSLKKIHELSHKRKVPYYIFTGQPDTASGTAFAEEHYDHYYEKDHDEDKLIEDIKNNADKLSDIQIIHKYQSIFDTWPELQHDLLRILNALEKEDWQNNSILNDIRKIMSDVVNYFYDKGLCNIPHNGSNLGQCSKDICQSYKEEIIPIYIQRSIHSLVAITNPGSHRTVTDEDVAKGAAPYLLRSIIFEMLNVLHWCKKMRNIEKDLVLAAIELAKRKYEEERDARTNSNN